MTVDQLKKAHEIVTHLEALEHLVERYREAEQITVKLLTTYIPGGNGETTFTAAEIGDAVVEALERRLANARAQLTAIGVAE